MARNFQLENRLKKDQYLIHEAMDRKKNWGIYWGGR